MKKRIICVLLTVLMVMSLFTGLSVSAYADDENPQVVEYTLKSGDYVLKLCQTQGINYFTCKEAIIKLNGLKSENDFRYLAVGRVIKLPVTDAAALNIVASSTSTSTSSTGTSGTTTGTVSVATGSDSVAYYLIPYTIQRGETVAGICNSLGISFSNYADQIMKLNNISSWNKVAAGKTLLLPSPKAPAVGTTCYQVVAHKVASGETAYNISSSYDVDYGQNTKLLQTLNNTSNLAKIKAGSTFYIPVATTIAATSSTGTSTSGSSTSTSGSSTTTSGSSTGTSTSGSSTSGSSTSTSTKKYSLTPNINTAYGTMTFYVNNATVSSAAAGDKVTVDVNTTDGKAISSLVVKHADGSADVKLEGNTFIMPGCNVRVDAEINSGYDIDIESNYPTITAATVSGVSASSASQGANVKIVSTDPSYTVESATVYYTTWLGIKKFVTVNDAMCFIMPADDVTVKATLKAVPTYNFYRADCVNGSFDLQVNGFSASKAAKGAQVTIVWKAMDGYTLSGISVTEKKTGTSVSVLNNSFTMPGCDVEVKLTFGKTDNAIVINAVEGGILNAYDTNGNSITEAKTGDLITIKLKDGTSEAGYGKDFNLTVTRNADGNLVSTAPANGPAEEYTFTMPAGGVTVDGQFIGDDKEISVTFNGGNNGNTVIVNDARLTADGSVKAAVGSKVTLSTLARDGYAFNRFEVSVDGEYSVEQSELANAQGYILMPNGAVTVEAFFTADAIPLEAASIRGSGDVSYQVSTTGKDGEYKTACSSKVGDWVKIIVKPSNAGFVVPDDAILVTDKATGKSIKLTEIDNTTYIFQMPSQGVDVSVILVGDPHKLTLKTVNADNNSTDLQGKSLWQISIEEDWPIVENDPNGGTTKADVKANDPIVLSLTEPGAANYEIDKVVLTTSGGVYAGGIEYIGNQYYFLMPDTDTTCTVYLKAKNTNEVSLTGCLIYDQARGSANFEMNGTAIGSCEAGDTVMVRATAADGYTFAADDVVITRADGGTLTSGTSVDNGNYVPVYEDKDGTAVLTGWIFKMPQGGVNVEISFKQVETNAVELKVYDENGTELTGNGYVSIQYSGSSFTDVSTDLGKVPYGSAVTVSLTDLGKSLYNLTKVTVDGVTCTDRGSYYGFYMPNATAKITVTLTAKVPEPVSYKLYSSYDYNKGTVGFYMGENPVDSATEDDTVSIVFTPAAGYMLDSYTIVRNTDNVTVKEETNLAEGSAKTVDVNMADVKDDFTVTAKFVNRTYKATIKLVDKDGKAIADENLVQFKGADGKYKAVKNGSEIEVVYDNTVNIGLTSTGNGYKITKYTITDASTSKVKTATDSNCSDFSFKVTKEGVSEIEIRLETK